MIIEVDRDDHSSGDGIMRTPTHGADHAIPQCDYPNSSGEHYQVNPEPRLEKLQDPVGTSEDLTAIEDRKDQLITTYAAEEIPLKVAEDAPTAIYALQAQIFNSADHTDNILQTGRNLKSHLRPASLNVNGLSQQKLPIILTYIKK